MDPPSGWFVGCGSTAENGDSHQYEKMKEKFCSWLRHRPTRRSFAENLCGERFNGRALRHASSGSPLGKFVPER
jgi:hypothetical protein